MKKHWIALVAGVISNLASAAVLFENPGSSSTQLSGACTPCWSPSGEQQMFDHFVLNGPAVVEKASFSIMNLTVEPLRQVQLSIWDSTLNHAIYSQDITLAQPLPRYYFGTLNLNVPNLQLAGGQYYISLFGLNSAELVWHFTEQATDGSVRIYNRSRNIWSDSDADAIFSLYGHTTPVPEVERLTALVAGLVLLGGVLRRRRF
ncbi:hypothetical protein FNU76_11365 [Chitinimonas arctica]|uniref:PEP-CTERM sorting domain-containing protein n=1 Tax=Chitinimonas arctica TaxID=2594795 RepID=A0A516SFH1_9NEIS|nr:hypothetical protein [Chitinimonas arctica]QDQ26911.1 hypothetical protein FNU76_11365 [Chitinimonas arctica]